MTLIKSVEEIVPFWRYPRFRIGGLFKYQNTMHLFVQRRNFNELDIHAFKRRLVYAIKM